MKQTFPSSRSSIVAICVALTGLTWMVFGQTLRHDFINYDDRTYVYENPNIIAGLTRPAIVWAFTHAHAGNWHPLTSISHMLDCQVYGLHASGHHLTNVILHIVAVVLLFLLLQRITGAFWRSAFVAAVFAIHPLRVESVAWIAERKDVLSGVLFMLTLLAYARYVSGERSIVRYLLVMFFFGLGLMAKSMLVTVPVVLLLLDYWPLCRFGSHSLGTAATSARRATLARLIVEKIPFFCLSLVSSLLTLWAQRAAMRSTSEIPLVLRTENAIVSYVRYLGQLLWPTDLVVFYPHAALPLLLIIGAIFALVAISTVVVRLRRSHPYLVTGWGWYLVMLLPVIGLVQVGAQAMADRYTYLPQIGIVLAITWAAADATAGALRLQRLMAITAVGITVALAWCGYHQTRYWRNSESIWGHTLALTNNNYVAHTNLGQVWLSRGRVEDAIHEFRTALEIRPEFLIAHNNLGVAFLKKGRFADAIQEFRSALSRDPQNLKCQFNLADAFLKSGRIAEATMEYQKVVATMPGLAQGHFELGDAYLRARRLADATTQFKIALQLQHGYNDAEYSLGLAELQNENRPEAIRRFRNTLALAPDYAPALRNLAVALLVDGQAGEAIPHFNHIVALEPANIEARNDLAAAFAATHQWSEAIRAWRASLQINRDNAAAKIGLGWALATAPEPALRNGAEALAISQHLSQTPAASNPMVFRVLGAAYAETGRFAEATEAANRGIALATSQNQAALAASLEGDLKLFQSAQPVRDAGESSSSR